MTEEDFRLEGLGVGGNRLKSKGSCQKSYTLSFFPSPIPPPLASKGDWDELSRKMMVTKGENMVSMVTKGTNSEILKKKLVPEKANLSKPWTGFLRIFGEVRLELQQGRKGK